MKTQKGFLISGMFKTLKFLGICLMLVALFAPGTQAQSGCEQEPLYIDPGTIGNGAKDFTVSAPSLRCITILWTDNKTLEYGDGTHFWLTPGAPYGGVYTVTFRDENLEVINQDIQCTNGVYEDGQPPLAGGTMIGPNNPIPFGLVDWGLAPCRSASVIRGIVVSGTPLRGVADFDWNWDNEDRPVVGQLQAGGNQPPIAEAGEPVTGTAGEPVAFNGSGSFDPEQGPLQYDWDFGDGRPPLIGGGPTPSYTYAASNTYNVTLTVTDDQNVSASDTVTATIGENSTPPTANAGGPYTGIEKVEVVFDGSASEGTNLTYQWCFGDSTCSGSDTAATTTHSYFTSNKYKVTLTVTDEDGVQSSSSTTASIVKNQPPVADAGPPVVGAKGQAVSFDGSASTDLDGDIVQYDWYFGDGNKALDAGPTPTHTYQEAGLYSVTLTVTNDDSVPASDSTTALIGESSQPPTADANGPYNGQLDAATSEALVSFDGSSSSDPDGRIARYDWDFGDGTDAMDAGPMLDKIYEAAGKYIVTLTVTDNSGETDTDTTVANVGIGNLPPQADAGDKVSGEAGRRITFDGTRSSDPDGDITSYAWDFGDGNTGTGPTPRHRYAKPGNYFVTLTVTDSDDVTDSDATLATVSSRFECVEACRAVKTECLNAADKAKETCLEESDTRADRIACRTAARAAKTICRADFRACRAACR